MNDHKYLKPNKRKINVLFIIVQIDIMGGSERLVFNLVRNLDRDRYNPSILWFDGDKKIEDFKQLNIPLFHVIKKRRFDFNTMRRIAEIIRDNGIDVINAHHFMSFIYSYYGSKILNSARLIYTEHSEWEVEDISWKWRKVGSYMMKRINAIVGVSQAVTALLEDRFDFQPTKAITIENGVELRTVPDTSLRSNVRRRLGLAKDDIVIGIVANLKKVKNHIFLLRVFKELLPGCDRPVKLLIIGQGVKGDPDNTEPEIRAYVEENSLKESVLLLGYRPDVSDILTAMDIFCLTSHKEGLPIGLLEAMAAGLPVIGTEVDGIRDVIVDKRNGFLLEPENTAQAVERLRSLLESDKLRKEMGLESRKIAVEQYSLNKCIEQYQTLFNTR